MTTRLPNEDEVRIVSDEKHRPKELTGSVDREGLRGALTIMKGGGNRKLIYSNEITGSSQVSINLNRRVK